MDKSIPKYLDIVIIGAGFSGLGQAIHLKMNKDFKSLSFGLFEKEKEVGGTWWINNYPGCACDVQSHLYSFSFANNPNWSLMFAQQSEIANYLKSCKENFDIEPNLYLGFEANQAQWLEDENLWEIKFRKDGSLFIIKAKFLISAIGALSRPFYPEIKGLKNFKGKIFHSQQWDHDYDLNNKKVAVIGTGASSIQFVPQIAHKAQKLYLYQRTPPWILPKPDRRISALESILFNYVPLSQKIYRVLIYLQLEFRAIGFTVNPKLMLLVEQLAKRHLKKQIKNPALREKLTPNYTIGCKRILISNDYYPTLNKNNVEVITRPIDKITSTEVINHDSGIEIKKDVDVIILGTGFDVTNPFGHMDIIGDNQVNLKDLWAIHPEAFLGTSIHGFPNLFTLLGPNTGLGHNSVIYMIESQINYINEALKWSLKNPNIKAFDIKFKKQKEFNDRLQQLNSKNVWSSGCKSWYLDKNGKIFTLWPTFTWKYRQLTKKFKSNNYDFYTH